MQAGDEADAGGVDGGDGLGDGAVGLDERCERDCDGDEEEGEGGGGDAGDGVVTVVAGAGDEGALDEGEGEGGVGDFGEGAAGGRDGDAREVERQELGVVRELVVDDGLGQGIVPDGVGREVGAGICGEGDPEPRVEGRGEGEGRDAEHDVEVGLRGDLEARGARGVAGGVAEVDEDDGGGPVEVGEVLVPEVDRVVDDREEEEVDGEHAARGLAADEGGDAAEVAAGEGALVAEVGGGGERLEDLFAEADEEQEADDGDGVGRVEVDLLHLKSDKWCLINAQTCIAFLVFSI